MVRSSPAASPLVLEARTTTRTVARTFAPVCRVLPREVRDDVYLLYLVFRTLDDLVDEGRPEAAAQVAAVAAWADGRDGMRTREVDVLEQLSDRYPLPRSAVAAFCAGMRQDMDPQRFATEADVDRYCFRVAGTVGLLMTAVLGARDPEAAEPAAVALGMAMQRTNILRDIEEDAVAGRVYLAQETVAAHASREALVRDQIARADALYERGLPGTRQLRRGGRAVAAAGAMYREILRQIERDGYGARSRAVVSPRRKLMVAARAALTT
jgi:15-cis-phytoene synthase